MASSSSEQQPPPPSRVNRNSGYKPRRSQSMYLPRNGPDEPDILKRRVRSTRGKRSKRSTLFSTRSIPKIPQVENSMDLFEKVICALRCCADNLKDSIHSSPITAKRSLEQKLKWCEDRLSQIEALFDFYTHETKMRQGARNLEAALLSYGVKHGHEKCKSNYKESTINMCEIEDEFEKRMGRFKIKIDGLDGFARLCTGDNFEIFVRNGSGRKWKGRCKIERDGQKWLDNEIEVKGSLKDGMFFRVIEVKKISSNVQLGSFSVRLRNYIGSNPMNLSIPVNKTGNLKLRVTVHWQPLSMKEEQKIKKTNRESLLSEVFFGSPVTISHDEPPRISVYSPLGFSPSSPSVGSTASTPTTSPFAFEKVPYENHEREETSSSVEQIEESFSEPELSEVTPEEIAATAEVEHEVEEDVGLETPPPPQLPKPSTLDQLIQRLQLALREHKDQYPQLQQLYEKLEKLDELLQGGKLRKTHLSGSVESALHSFSFLDITEVGLRPDREIRPFDTGYCSNDEATPATGENPADVTTNDGATPGSDNGGVDVRTASADMLVKLQDGGASKEVTERLSQKRDSSHSSLKQSRGSGIDTQSQTSDVVFVGISIIDKVVHQHVKFCLRLTEDLGSMGPLKSKESSAVVKLEWQSGILEKLIELANLDSPPQTISKAYSPLAASGHDEILLFWAGNCGENPLYIESSEFLKALKKQFHQVVEEAYCRIADKLYPVITTRILEDNGTAIVANIEEDSVISIYQFTDFFLTDHRWNLVKFVNDVAEELLTCGRLLNTDKAVVLTQLQMYNKIPFKHSCCVTAARLLIDSDPQINAAAGVYFETLVKDVHRRAQAISYCIEALEDGDEIQRAGACAALGKLQGEEAIVQLSFLAKCDTGVVKEAAGTALAVLDHQFDESEVEKNAKIWKQTTKMSDLSKSTDF